MGYAITDIEGVGPAFGEKLTAAGIKNTETMLELCGTKKGRQETAEKTGIPEKKILTFTNHCDLMRIKGVAGQFAELLEAAGVDTVKELRNRNAANLAAAMTKCNEEKNLTNGNISESQVQGWIDQAKELDPKVSH